MVVLFHKNKEKKFSKQLASDGYHSIADIRVLVGIIQKLLVYYFPHKTASKFVITKNHRKSLKCFEKAHHWPGFKRRRIQFPGATAWRLCAKAPLLFLYLINIIMSYYIFIFILAGSNIY